MKQLLLLLALAASAWGQGGISSFPPSGGGGGGGATIPSVTNIIKGNGSGNGADSGIAATAVGIFGTFSSLGLYNATSNAMVCDDSTDDTTAFNSLLATVNTAGGGTIYLSGMCKIAGAVVLPNDGASPPTQHPIRITGCGSTGWKTSATSAPATTPCGLNLFYNASIAKLDTRGQGLLEIDHIEIKDTNSDTSIFIQTTNTTLKIHHAYFRGTGAGSNTVGIVFGGTTTTVDGSATSPFQGYGTVIDSNVFDNMGVIAKWQAYANAIQVVNNTITTTSGGASAFDLSSTYSAMNGNYLAGNLIEMAHYVTGVLCGASCIGNSFIGNSTYDPNSGSSTSAYTMTGSTGNIIISSYDGVGAKAGWVNVLNPGTTNYVLASNTANGVGASGPQNYPQPFGATFYNDGGVLVAANSAPFTLPFACTIQGWNASVAPSGTATFKVWKIATGTVIPTVSNSINTSGVGVSSGTSVKSTTLSDFTATTVSPNDIVIISMTAVTGSPTSATFGVQCQ